MPIYAYKCDACGFEKDVLQKMSDAPLTDCPECGQASFRKQVTVAGFQLKGSGWYVTDFRQNGKPATAAKETNAGVDKSAPESSKSTSPSSASAAAAPSTSPALAASASSATKAD